MQIDVSIILASLRLDVQDSTVTENNRMDAKLSQGIDKILAPDKAS